MLAGNSHGRGKGNALPEVNVAVALRQLRALIDEMASCSLVSMYRRMPARTERTKEEVVGGRHGHRVAHKHSRVDDQGGRHLARDAVVVSSRPAAIARRGGTDTSGSFRVMSITAASGMPKLETGPQKSVSFQPLCVGWDRVSWGGGGGHG